MKSIPLFAVVLSSLLALSAAQVVRADDAASGVAKPDAEKVVKKHRGSKKRMKKEKAVQKSEAPKAEGSGDAAKPSSGN